MDAEPTDASEISDHQLNEALEAHALEVLDGLSIKNQRLARIQEYEEAALSRADAFSALIGLGNSDLQRIFDHMSAAILEELESRADSVEAIHELVPKIRLLVKVRNSIEKDLAVQPPDAEQQTTVFRQGSQGNGFNRNLANSKRDMLPKRTSSNRANRF